MSDYPRPLPEVDSVTEEFWHAAQQERFLLYQCASCGSYYYPANECTSCDDIKPEMRWVEASGKGTLHTWIVMHRSYHAGFEGDIPYNVALVRLEEGPFFLTNIVGCANEDLASGMNVEVTFEAVTEEITLPRFRPV